MRRKTFMIIVTLAMALLSACTGNSSRTDIDKELPLFEQDKDGNSNGEDIYAGENNVREEKEDNKFVDIDQANNKQDTILQGEMSVVCETEYTDSKNTNLDAIIVDAVVKVYDGVYIEETGLFDANLEDKTLIYYSVQTSNVTNNSFDFQIVAVPVENGNIRDDWLSVFRAGTAYFIEDGKKAVYHNDTENLYFLFGDDQIEPTLGKIEIDGVEELEGKVYINNSIPGHEAG